MSHDKNIKKKTPVKHIGKKTTALLTIVWMIIIFTFSAQPATQSSQISGSLGYKIASWKNDLLRENKTKAELYAQSESMQLLIRKGAHMTEYALLAILLYLHLSYYKINKKQMMLFVLGITAGYAASDEFHQLFVPGRAGQFSDICIDSLGGLLGLLFCLLIKKLFSNSRRPSRLTLP